MRPNQPVSAERQALLAGQASLRERILAAQAKAPGELVTKSVKSVEDYRKSDISVTLGEHHVDWTGGRILYRETPKGKHVPVRPTTIAYNISAFLSSEAETFGLRVEGASINIMGYDIATDAEGNILEVDVPNPAYVEGGEEPQFLGKTPKLIDQDEHQQPLEPQLLMIFRPQWGRDQSKQSYTQRKNIPRIALIPNIGVPRKKTQSKPMDDNVDPNKAEHLDAATAERRWESVDWNLIPNLEPEMKNPLLKAYEDEVEALYPFIDTIKYARVTETKQAEGKKGGLALGGGQSNAAVTKAASGLPEDVFPGAPEALKTAAS